VQSIEYKKYLVESNLTLNTGIITKYRNFKKQGLDISSSLESKYNQAMSDLNNFMNYDIKNAIKLNNSMYQKNKRLMNRITAMSKLVDNQFFFAYFATFTINDNYINLSLETLKKYLKRILKQYCIVYVANNDYGDKTQRLHFHAIVLTDNVEDLKKDWTAYGFIKTQKVDFKNEDEKKISKYITKLTNHSLKKSTKPLENKLIYSRGFYFE